MSDPSESVRTTVDAPALMGRDSTVMATTGRRAADASLVRAMGIAALTASIINITIGGGIFRLPAAAAAHLGPAAPLAYVVCAVAMMLIVLCFASAGSRVSLTGGAYAYVEVAFGPLVGWLSGVLLWVGLGYALAAVATFLMDSLGALIPVLRTPAIRSITLVVILGALSALNVRGVGLASRFNTVITVAKLLPLLLLVVVGAMHVRPQYLAIEQLPRVADVGRSSLVLLFAFLGLEAALVPSGEVRDPARTIPRSVLTATVVIAVIYLLVHIVAQGLLGPLLADQKTPLAEAGAVAMGSWGRTLILVGSAISMFGYVSGMTLASPRMLFAFARDGFFPAALARVHPTYRTPHIAIWAQTIIVTLLAITGRFEALAIIANGAILLVYVGCALAAMELRRKNVRTDGTPFDIPGTSIAPPLALIVIAFMLSTLTRAEWLWILAMVAGALLLYLLRRHRISTSQA